MSRPVADVFTQWREMSGEVFGEGLKRREMRMLIAVRFGGLGEDWSKSQV